MTKPVTVQAKKHLDNSEYNDCSGSLQNSVIWKGKLNFKINIKGYKPSCQTHDAR